MPSNTSTLSELRNEVYSSTKRLENSEARKSKGNSLLIQDIRNLKSAVIRINRFLLAISSDLERQKLVRNHGTCIQHERLGLVTWERGDVPCPVCERNKFVEFQAEKLGMKQFPVWDAYFCLWDLPPLESKKRVEEFGEKVRGINERKKNNQNEVK